MGNFAESSEFVRFQDYILRSGFLPCRRKKGIEGGVLLVINRWGDHAKIAGSLISPHLPPVSQSHDTFRNLLSARNGAFTRIK